MYICRSLRSLCSVDLVQGQHALQQIVLKPAELYRHIYLCTVLQRCICAFILFMRTEILIFFYVREEKNLQVWKGIAGYLTLGIFVIADWIL